MNIFDTVILGLVEGITEFLPVSSTGHLILANHLLGHTGEVEATFDVFIQLGAILAVVVIYFKRFLRLFDFSPRPADQAGFYGLSGWYKLLLTSIPAMVIGFLAKDFIKSHLFGDVTVLIALVVGAIAILIVERIPLKATTHSIDDITPRQAFQVGVFQCFALWPGMSRSASTIIGGMLGGLDRKVAVEYSFFAAVPIMVMATLYDLYKSRHLLQSNDMQMFALGFVIAFISALFAIKFFIRLVERFSLTPYAIYRIAIAAIYFLFVIR